MGGFLQVNSVFFRRQITFFALQYLKIIQIWQFIQNEAQVYVQVFTPYGLVQTAQLFVCIAAADINILFPASVLV